MIGFAFQRHSSSTCNVSGSPYLSVLWGPSLVRLGTLLPTPRERGAWVPRGPGAGGNVCLGLHRIAGWEVPGCGCISWVPASPGHRSVGAGWRDLPRAVLGSEATGGTSRPLPATCHFVSTWQPMWERVCARGDSARPLASLCPLPPLEWVDVLRPAWGGVATVWLAGAHRGRPSCSVASVDQARTCPHPVPCLGRRVVQHSVFHHWSRSSSVPPGLLLEPLLPGL